MRCRIPMAYVRHTTMVNKVSRSERVKHDRRTPKYQGKIRFATVPGATDRTYGVFFTQD